MVTREEEEAKQKRRRRKAIVELYKTRLGSLKKAMDLSKKGKLTYTFELTGYVNGSTQSDRSFVNLTRVFIIS